MPGQKEARKALEEEEEISGFLDLYRTAMLTYLCTPVLFPSNFADSLLVRFLQLAPRSLCQTTDNIPADVSPPPQHTSINGFPRCPHRRRASGAFSLSLRPSRSLY